MLLPVDQDRIPLLAKLKDKYNATAPLVTKENAYATLGLLGGIGFLLLLAIIILRWQVNQEAWILSQLNLCGLLFATIGGFGSLFSYALSPMIRCYARMSIFIAFFSLYAFFYFLEKVTEKYIFFKKIKWFIALMV